MDKDVIQKKIEGLIKCIQRIESQQINTLEDLEQSLDKQEIIILNLERAVQICIDIGNHILIDYKTQTPTTMSETFKLLFENNIISKENAENLSHAVGFRNIAVHQYQDLDNKIIFSIIKNCLKDFRQFSNDICQII